MRLVVVTVGVLNIVALIRRKAALGDGLRARVGSTSGFTAGESHDR
jgi:hypothetical protein